MDKNKDKKFVFNSKKNGKFNNKSINTSRISELKIKDRIAKRLAMLGVASRREAEQLVINEKVKVNGIVCKELNFLVGYDDRISVNGKDIINKPIRTQIFIMNKPSGYVTTNNDPQGRKTIFELIPNKFGRLITVGRLDFNTEGLLLLTNNGELARVMEMPSTALKRIYYARVVGDVNSGVLEKLSSLKNGIKIDGVEYGKMIVEVESYSQTKATLRIIIFEGKNNEIRRIMWHLGLKVVKLTRVQYGDFRLHGLPLGCVQESHLKINLRELERRADANAKRYNLNKIKEKEEKKQTDVKIDETDILKTKQSKIIKKNVKDIDDCEKFIKNDAISLFKEVGAGEKIISLWLSQIENMGQIMSSKMVQGMKNGTLTQEQFDDLYMKPDVLYIYNLGVALKKRAELETNGESKQNITMIAEMFMSYEDEFHFLQKNGLNQSDKLDDDVCKKHSDLFANVLTVSEYYVAILTDMMPYVCFSNFLYKNISSNGDNIWFEYAKKYGTKDCDYVKNKLSKSFQIANKVLDEGLVSIKKAKELFEDGFSFERYFIEKAMCGELVKKIKRIEK